MPSARRSRHDLQIARLRTRIAQLEGELSESRKQIANRRNIQEFAARHLSDLGFGVGIFSLDWRRAMFVGAGLGRLFGYPAEQIRAAPGLLFDSIDAEDLPQVRDAVAAGARGKVTEVTFRIRRDGAVRWIRSRFCADPPPDEPRALVAVFVDVTDQRLLEEVARANEERFRLLTDAAPIGIFLTDENAQVIYINPRLQAIAGFAEEDLLGLGFTRVYAPEEREKHLADWLRIATTPGQHDAEQTIINGRGEVRWLHVRSVPRISRSGAVMGRIGSVEDITERRLAELVLRDSEERYRLLAEHATDMISKHASDGVFLYVSPACRALLGYEPEELVDTHALDLVHPEDREALHSLGEASTWPSTLTCRARRKDGQHIWLEVRWKSIPLPPGAAAGANVEVVAVSRDVSLRRADAERVLAGETRMRAILDTTSDGIITVDESGTIELFNPGAEHLFGYRADEVMGQNVGMLLVRQPAAGYERRSRRPAPFRRPLGRTRETVGRRKDGSICDLEIRVSENNVGGRSIFTAILHDISRRKRTERMLRETEKLAATGRIAARIAHEINNPLAGIKNSFLLLKDAIPPGHEHFGYVGRIEKEIDRIADIVRQTFDLYRPAPTLNAAIALSDTVQDVVALLRPVAHDRAVAFEIDTARASGLVFLADDALRQVLYGVIVNAIEASPPGAVVRIEAVAASGAVDIFIADSGPGIPPDLRLQIYEPFFTTKCDRTLGGLGLGLSIARGIVEAVHGVLDFQSNPGGGTVFHICFPVIPQEGEVSHVPGTSISIADSVR
jgi:PAS domain S-box-containing protein